MAPTRPEAGRSACCRSDDPGLRALLQDWLHNVYVADDAADAFAERAAPAGRRGASSPAQGHLVSRVQRAFLRGRRRAGRHAGAPAGNREHRPSSCARSTMLADEARSRAVARRSALSRAHAQRLQELRQRVASADPERPCAADRRAQAVRSAGALQPAQQRRSAPTWPRSPRRKPSSSRSSAESEAQFEQLDMELAELQERARRRPDRLPGAASRALADARQRLRELERAAQEAQFAEKSQRSRIDELRRNIATAAEQAAQLGAQHRTRASRSWTALDDRRAQDGLAGTAGPPQPSRNARWPTRAMSSTSSRSSCGSLEEARMQAERSLQPQRDSIMELQLKEQAARLNQEQFAAAPGRGRRRRGGAVRRKLRRRHAARHTCRAR